MIAEVIIKCIDAAELDSGNAPKRLLEAGKCFGGFLGTSFLHALESIALKKGIVEVKGDMFHKIVEEYQKTAHPEKAYLNEFEATLESWINKYLEGDSRLAVFIDDLDRCLPEVVLEVLEALKLYLDIPKLFFVVGLDRTVVDGVISNHYKKHGLGEDKSRHYLDKIFQVETYISPGSTLTENYLNEQVNAFNKNLGSSTLKTYIGKPEYWNAIETLILDLSENNPREIKRILNSMFTRAYAAYRDETLVVKGEKDLRFAQGAQIYLLQHYLLARRTTSPTVIVEANVIKWLKKWSQLAQTDPFPEQKKGDLSDKADKSESQEIKALIKTQPDKLNLLNIRNLWALMQIPFSEDVANPAPLPFQARKSSGIATNIILVTVTWPNFPAGLRKRLPTNSVKTLLTSHPPIF